MRRFLGQMRTRRFLSTVTVLMSLVSCGGGNGGSPTEPDPAPEILSLQPNPVRAGEDLIISGQNLQPSVGVLPAQQGVTVLLGNRTLTPVSASSTEVVVEIPLDVAPGNHTLRVRAGNRDSGSRQLQVNIFTVTGTYAASGPQITDTCEVDDTPIGGIDNFQIAFTDNRPTLVIRIGAADPITGTLGEAGDFSGQNSEVINPDTGLTATDEISGSMQARQGPNAGFTATFSLSFSGGVLPACTIRWTLDGNRITTVPTDKGSVEGLSTPARSAGEYIRLLGSHE